MTSILLVDDSRFGRNSLRRALEPQGYILVEATNGREALDLVEQADPDCVLTDLLMPEMDGMEFLRHLRSRGDQRPVIVISADIQDASRQTCLDLGISAFLNKPFKAVEIIEAVGMALGCASTAAAAE